MKTAINFGIFALLITAVAQARAQSTNLSPATPYLIAAQDGNSRTWEKTDYEISPSGKVIPHKHHVVELATGLNYWDGKQWSPSIPSFQISDDGRSVFANAVQHKVRLSANLNADSSVNITTPDGLVLHTTPVAIGLYDEGNSNSVIIAAITNCSGTLISSNQVVFRDAFDDVAADILYTLKRGSFSQDVVLKQNIDPSDYGCSSNSLIQIFTEFYHSPKPTTTKGRLCFGQLIFGPGRAYTGASTNQAGGAPVTREYKTISGRAFLIESVKFGSLQKELQKLPRANASLTAGAKLVEPSKRRYARIPSPGAATKVTVLTRQPQHEIARIDRQSGVLIDYQVLDGAQPSPMIFQGDTTYFMSGEVDCEDVIFEGGTVLKYPCNTTPAQISQVGGTVICNTGPYSG